jgi:hypothetical protein
MSSFASDFGSALMTPSEFGPIGTRRLPSSPGSPSRRSARRRP